MLSNGPGDPAAMPGVVNEVRELAASGVPVFGICLGHQVLALSQGLTTEKMFNGHRGVNHPVKNLISGKCEITSQNHGFVVSDHADWQSLIQTIQQSEARQIYATHGETRVLTRYLTDHMGVAADCLETAFGIEQGADQ